MRDRTGGGLGPLKFIVFSLGILLIGGMLLLFALIIQRNHHQASAEITSCTTDPVTVKAHLPLDQVIKDGATITLVSHPTVDHNQQITILDSCSGKVLHRITVNNFDK